MYANAILTLFRSEASYTLLFKKASFKVHDHLHDKHR